MTRYWQVLWACLCRSGSVEKSPEEEEQVFTVVRPVAEKMAHLVAGWLAGYPVDDIYGRGASSFRQFADVFRHATGKRVIQARRRCW